MRIAVLATNRNPLSRPYAGGQESLTAALVSGFRAQGHRVLLFAAAGTPRDLADELIVYPSLPPLSEVAALDHQISERDFLVDHHAFTFAMGELAARDDVDVVANHSLHHLPMSLSRVLTAPVVTTLHTPPFAWMELGAALAAPTARYVAVSNAVAAQWTTLTTVTVVRNGADPSAFVLGPGSRAADGTRSHSPGPSGVHPGVGSAETRGPSSAAGGASRTGPLAWVGRITPEKAPHLAIAAARRAGRGLRIVGPISDAAYFATQVEPQLDVEARLSDEGGDGTRVEYLGPLTPEGVAEVVGTSDALLVTPVWDEPFGLVAAEAALCGTPVVALHRGGVAEAVAPGAGVLVPDAGGATDAERVAGLVAGLDDVVNLDRRSVRAAAVTNLSLDVCVAGHLTVLADACRDAHAHVPTDLPGRGD